jgi:hypothetical protein
MVGTPPPLSSAADQAEVVAHPITRLPSPRRSRPCVVPTGIPSDFFGRAQSSHRSVWVVVPDEPGGPFHPSRCYRAILTVAGRNWFSVARTFFVSAFSRADVAQRLRCRFEVRRLAVIYRGPKWGCRQRVKAGSKPRLFSRRLAGATDGGGPPSTKLHQNAHAERSRIVNQCVER